MKNSIFYLIAAVFGLFSCSATHEISFNKDWSGSISTVVDYTQMTAMMGENSTSMSEDSSNVAKMEKLSKLKGLSNFKTDKTDNNFVKVSYDFKDIESLNLSSNIMFNDVEFIKDEYFKLKSPKELEIIFPNQSMEEAGDDMSMFEQFGLTLIINMKRKIKNVTSNCNSAKTEGNKVTITTSLMELMDANKCHSTIIKVK